MEPPADATRTLDAFLAAMQPVTGALGLYAGGSLATDDYRPVSSDLDLVAVIPGPLTSAQQAALVDVHQQLMRDKPAAAKLHCAYVPLGEIADPGVEHLTWAHGELYRRIVSGIARAELHSGGVVLHGPPPGTYFPPVDRAALRAAAIGEMTGYWRGAVRKPWLWQQDVYVDLGLLSLARAEIAVRQGRQSTKTEALVRLREAGVRPHLVDEIARRRDGLATPLSRWQRLRRGDYARRTVAAGIRGLAREV